MGAPNNGARALPAFFAALLALLLAASADLAAGTKSTSKSGAALKETYRKSATIRKKIDASQSAMKEMARREKSIMDELNRAEQDLDEARLQVRSARAECQELQARVAILEQRHARVAREIAAAHTYMSRRLVALYKLGGVGHSQLLASAPSFYEFVTRKRALERILAQDETQLEKLHADRSALAVLLEQLNAGKTEKESAQRVLDRRIEQLAVEQARRTALLNTIRSRKELQRAAISALRKSAAELDGIIARLKEPAAPAPASSPGISRDESTGLSKGLLGWPVRGKIISFFGPYRDEKTHLVNFQSGVDIKAERGEPVRAAGEGQTIYAGWFKGYGNVMIVDHGHHYYTVYAHLEEVFRAKGDRVEKGEVVATVGDSGSLSGPALHFEVRHHGNPVDPLAWMNKE